MRRWHLPSVIEKIADQPDGLVLVTGPTGCGKTTTIASMIDHINRNKSYHIVTIEDPIEYFYRDQKCIVSQREVGIDVPNYNDALRSLMREDPDVVVVGEMRDNETLTAAMRALKQDTLFLGHFTPPARRRPYSEFSTFFRRKKETSPGRHLL